MFNKELQFYSNIYLSGPRLFSLFEVSRWQLDVARNRTKSTLSGSNLEHWNPQTCNTYIPMQIYQVKHFSSS